MTYPDSVRFLYSLGNELKAGAKWGLERMSALTEALGRPDRQLRLVHVAGTNGKGSTCAMIAAALEAAGLRTGLYTSPHLIEPTERIQVNGRPVSDDQFREAFQTVHTVAERLQMTGVIDAQPSYFETVTAMAFLLFAGLNTQACDIAVIEVGLGGRLDATNIISSGLSVITPVSMDHEAYLGSTLELIGAEKAGIIKQGVPVVSAPQADSVECIIRERAVKMDARLQFTRDLRPCCEEFTARGSSFYLDGVRYECNLPGRHQQTNAITAIAACRQLGLPTEAMQHGLAKASWPGRLEYISSNPDLVLDGAHNPAGAHALASYIQEFCSGRPVWIVYGTMRDKAIDEVVTTLFPLAQRVLLTAPDVLRALRPQAIAAVANRPDATITETVAKAIEEAKKAPKDAIVFFTGSLFVVGEARRLLLESGGAQ